MSRMLSRRVETFARRTATAVRLEELYRLGRGVGAERLHLAQLVHRELAIRNAQLCKELLLLPFGLPETRGVQDVVSWFSSYVDWLAEFPPPATENEDEKFRDLLNKILKDNSDVTRTLGTAVHEVRAALGEERYEEVRSEITLILDRFFIKRIGLRFLIQHHIASFEQSPGVAGIIHSNVAMGPILRAAAAEARAACEREWGVAPRIVVAGDGDERHNPAAYALMGNIDLSHNRSFTYVPIHLHIVCYELLLNSCEAVARNFRRRRQREQRELLMSVAASAPSPRRASSQGEGVPAASLHASRWEKENLPAVRAIFAHGSEEVTVKVSDEGGGIPRSELEQAWSYFDKLPSNTDRGDGCDDIPSLPRGAGLPLTRLHARYYGGDVVLKSMEGYGTDAYVSLSRLGQSCENLPAGVRVSPAQLDSSMGQAASIRLLEALGGDLGEEEVSFLTGRLREYRAQRHQSMSDPHSSVE